MVHDRGGIALADRPLLLDQAGAAHAVEGGETEALLLRLTDRALDPRDQSVDGLIAVRLVVGMAPEPERLHLGSAETGAVDGVELDDAVTDVGPADVGGGQAVEALEQPGQNEARAADQRRRVGVMILRHHVDIDALALENDRGPADGKLADPALPEATADRDALAPPAAP